MNLKQNSNEKKLLIVRYYPSFYATLSYTYRPEDEMKWEFKIHKKKESNNFSLKISANFRIKNKKVFGIFNVDIVKVLVYIYTYLSNISD